LISTFASHGPGVYVVTLRIALLSRVHDGRGEGVELRAGLHPPLLPLWGHAAIRKSDSTNATNREFGRAVYGR
jgi:hypothetical protein